jgi:chorismate synthase
LQEFSIDIRSHTVAIGGVSARLQGPVDWDQVERSPVRCADRETEKAMMAAIDDAASGGDTVGGVFEVVATGVPVGLGSHVHWDRRLDGRIAQAIMSIPSIKGVEIGSGFRVTDLRGSQAHDVIQVREGLTYGWRRATNQAGGIEGGISNGEPIIVRAAVKPVPTLRKPLPTIDLSTRGTVQAHFERSDVCVVPAAGVIGEAMLAIVLADALLEKFGGDSLKETRRNYEAYLKSIWESE